MLMSDRNHNQLRLDSANETFERFRSRERKLQRIGALPRLVAKMLAEQIGDIGFVVDNQDAYGHDAPFAPEEPAALPAARRRGRDMVNSVNLPTSLATLIMPPCCCVTTS